jgi:hypothetical protein
MSVAAPTMRLFEPISLLFPESAMPSTGVAQIATTRSSNGALSPKSAGTPRRQLRPDQVVVALTTAATLAVTIKF